MWGRKEGWESEEVSRAEEREEEKGKRITGRDEAERVRRGGVCEFVCVGISVKRGAIYTNFYIHSSLLSLLPSVFFLSPSPLLLVCHDVPKCVCVCVCVFRYSASISVCVGMC